MRQQFIRFFGIWIMVWFAVTPALAVDGGQDAGPLYRKAGELLHHLPQDFPKQAAIVFENGWKASGSNLEEVLEENREAMAVFLEATTQRNCSLVSPVPFRKDVTTPVPQYTNEVNVAKLVLIEGCQHETAGDWHGAMESYLSVMRFSGHIGGQEDFMLFHKMMSVILQERAAPLLGRLAANGGLNEDDLRHLLDDLQEIRAQETGLEQAFAEEMIILKNSIRLSAKNKNRFLKGILKIVFVEFDRAVDEFGEDLVASYRENNPERFEMGRGSILKGPFAFAGRQMAIETFPRFQRMITKYYSSLMALDVLITGIAVKLYEGLSGRAPEHLEDLVPDYLQEIPKDAFHAFTPIQYSHSDEGWVVYSVGQDLVDDQGRVMANLSEGMSFGDIVFLSSERE